MVNVGDITIQPQATVGTPQKVIQITRDLTTATGSVGYTGVGFKPSYINVYGLVSGNTVACWGMDNSSDTPRAMYRTAGAAGIHSNTAQLILLDFGSGNNQYASVSSFDSDGFTLNWTKTGSPTGTGVFFVTAFK